MSHRGQYRGSRGGNRGGHTGRSNYDVSKAGMGAEKPKKENILDLGKYMDKKICVKMSGGREESSPGKIHIYLSTYCLIQENKDSSNEQLVTGVLKGYDALMNLVLDDVEESMHDDENKITTRALGLVVVRGTLLVLISPVDGSEEIANPFVQAED